MTVPVAVLQLWVTAADAAACCGRFCLDSLITTAT
jgi:hypothetical protein